MVLSLWQQRSAGNVSSCPNSRGILNATNAAVGSPRDRPRETEPERPRVQFVFDTLSRNGAPLPYLIVCFIVNPSCAIALS